MDILMDLALILFKNMDDEDEKNDKQDNKVKLEYDPNCKCLF